MGVQRDCRERHESVRGSPTPGVHVASPLSTAHSSWLKPAGPSHVKSASCGSLQHPGIRFPNHGQGCHSMLPRDMDFKSCRAHRNSFKESCLVHGDSSGQAAPLVMAIPRRLLLLSWRWKDPVRAPDFTSCPEWTSASMLKPGRSSCSCGLSCSCV